MKRMFARFAGKGIGHFAVLLATVGTVGTNCWILLHQEDTPEELMNR